MPLRNLDEAHVVVPREPTPEMLKAARELYGARYFLIDKFIRRQWAVMLEKAEQANRRA